MWPWHKHEIAIYTKLTNNYNTIRFDYAMSTNRDGATVDESLLADGVHPNANGHKRMAEQAKLELGLLI